MQNPSTTKHHVSFTLNLVRATFVGLLLLLPATVRAQNSISYGDIVTESISSSGEVDRFTFEGSEGDPILVRMSELSGGNNFVDKLEILAPDGAPLKVGLGAIQVEHRVTLPASGTYTLLASDNDIHTGSYTLFIQRMVDPVGATPFAYGDMIPSAAISQVGMISSYTFEGREDDPILIRMSELSGGNNFVDKLEILAPDGSSFKVTLGAIQVEHRITLPVTGTYTLLASDNDIHTGSYSLFLQRMVDPVGATSIAYGDIVPKASIAQVGLISSFTFEGREGDPILVRMSELSGGNNFVDKLEILSPDGSSFNVSLGAIQVEDRVTLPTSGTYTLLASDNDIHTGSYSLFLQRMVDPVGTTSIAYGETHTDTISIPGLIKSFVFSGSIDDLVLIRMSELSGGNNFVDKLEILAPDGTTLEVGLGAIQVEHRFTLPMAGTYVIFAGDNDIHTGAFTIFLEGIIVHEVTVTPHTLNFAGVGVGNAATDLIKLSNATEEDFEAAVSITGADASYFTVSPESVNLPASTNQEFSVSFAPDAMRDYEAVLEIDCDCGNFAVQLLGEGVSGDVSEFFAASLRVIDENGHQKDLVFGTHTDATDGYDIALDELFPPIPPEGVFDVRFLGNTFDLQKDIRGPIDSVHTWQLRVQPSVDGNQIVLHWNPETLPHRGGIRLKDVENAGLVNIDMRVDSMYLNQLALTDLIIVYSLGDEEIWASPLRKGWNLVGLPVIPSASDVQTLFPNATSASFFSFEEAYVVPMPQTLQAGAGYWLHMPEADTVRIPGEVMRKLEIELKEGWNLISGPSCSVAPDAIQDPDGIFIPGTAFGFDGAYYSASSVTPSRGYWVRALAAGAITLDCAAGSTTSVTLNPMAVEGLGLLKVSDEAGKGSLLMFGNLDETGLDERSFSMPPIPPGNTFDVRYEGDLRLAQTSSTAMEWQGIEGSLLVEVLTTSMTGAYALEEITELGVKNHRVLDVGTPLRIAASSTVWIVNQESVTSNEEQDFGNATPRAFKLEGNYPNPFNPETTITFQVPADAHISLTVYDLMGRKIKTLVNRQKAAGTYSEMWDATASDGSKVSSGLYFYVLESATHGFKASGRMMLVK